VWLIYIIPVAVDPFLREFLLPSPDNVLEGGNERDLGQDPTQTLSQLISTTLFPLSKTLLVLHVQNSP
jgi:hypothetical protein